MSAAAIRRRVVRLEGGDAVTVGPWTMRDLRAFVAADFADRVGILSAHIERPDALDLAQLAQVAAVWAQEVMAGLPASRRPN